MRIENNVTKIVQREQERESKKNHQNNKTMTNRATDKIDQGDIKPLNKEIKKTLSNKSIGFE